MPRDSRTRNRASDSVAHQHYQKTADYSQLRPSPSIGFGLEEEEELFEEYIRVRSPDKWRQYDIDELCRMIQYICRRDELMYQATEEGFVLYNQRGTPVLNPKGTAATQMHGEARRLAVSLGIIKQPNTLKSENKTGKSAEERNEEKAQEIKGQRLATVHDLLG